MQQLTIVNHDDNDDGSYKIIFILLNTILMKNINHNDEDSIIDYNIIFNGFCFRVSKQVVESLILSVIYGDTDIN